MRSQPRPRTGWRDERSASIPKVIHVLEIDLERPHDVVLPVAGEAWILVRAGADVIGQVRIDRLEDHVLSPIDLRLREWLGQRLYARRHIRPHVTHGGLRADDVTIAVCTRDRPELLRDWLRAAIGLHPPPGEILIVDNAPTSDRTRLLAEEFGVRYTCEPTPGLDRARDLAWRQTTTQIVAFVDDDARLDRRYVAAVASSFFAPSIGGMTGLTLPFEVRTFYQEMFERIEGMGKGFVPKMFGRGANAVGFETWRLGAGANMAFRREVLESIGGFDPRLDVGTRTRGGGDLDILYRVLGAGWLIRYEPQALVFHIHREDKAALLKQMVDWGTGYVAYLKKTASESSEEARAVRRYRYRWHFRRHVARPLRALVRGRWLEFQMSIAEAYGSLRGRRALAEETEAIQREGARAARSWTGTVPLT